MRLGFIKLARQLQEHAIWLGERFTRGQAWVDLLMLAQFTSYELRIRGNSVPLERGQIGHSKAYLAGRWKWDRKTVQKYLDDLENDGMITQQKTRVVTVITIVNYSTWQDREDDDDANDGQQNPPQTGQQDGQQNPQQDGQQNGHKEEGKERGKKVKKVEEEPTVFPEVLDTDAFRAKWEDWLTYRKDNRREYKSPVSVKSALTQLAKVGEAVAIDALDQAIGNGWVGFHFDRSKDDGKPTTPKHRPGRVGANTCTDEFDA
jgi:hypothetical protein